MENQYNFILGIFIVIVFGCVAVIYFAYLRNLPLSKKNQISTQIYSPFNNRGDSIKKSPTTLVLEKYFAREIHPEK